mmetsp:Transcript_1468/g.2820  ORF Transcript_1468/g.2820 Transcript_1468/m.2820 type:complete len:733 (-) Transcript_1468:83-2281(-)
MNVMSPAPLATPWRAFIFVMMAFGIDQAKAQGDVAGAQYVGEGTPRDGAGANSYTESDRGAFTSATACKSECDGNFSTPNLKGFSFYADSGDSNNNVCRCWTGGAGDIVDTDGTSATATEPGYTYCYSCLDPSAQPSKQSSDKPSDQPSFGPSESPSFVPSESPSEHPSEHPSEGPSEWPSSAPSEGPTSMPSSGPSQSPSSMPSSGPSSSPSNSPSSMPSGSPSAQPSAVPSNSPSSMPSESPSTRPSSQPSALPSSQPSAQPSAQPSSQPSESPSANPSQGCENIRTDCGWGIFNPWTCRCDCPVGICLDNNQQCYHPCAETIHTNPWAGCYPGWDCPWFPDPESDKCLSEMHQPNNFEIYRTAKECCTAHYSGKVDSCVFESQNLHIRTVGDVLHLRDNGGHPVGSGPYPWPIHFPGTENHRPFAPPEAREHWMTEASHRARWFPDMHNKLNCVFGDNYENWMQEDGFAENYLSKTSEDCCERWYPDRSDCPDNQRAVNPEAEDEPWHSNPSPMQNYFFPDFSKNNCGHGWDYPAWMGSSAYEKHYLFRQGRECCSRFFPMVSNCPYERTTQLDYQWTSYQDRKHNLVDMPIIYNHTYYPDMQANTCVNGTDYPDWMGRDVDFKRLYLFKDLEGCCNHWFTDFDLDGCMRNVIQGIYDVEPCPTNRPECHHVPSITNVTEHRLGMWYPDLDGYKCKNDGSMPDWMLEEEYTEWYLFNTKEQCCSAFGYC